jgi:hypothetical protein
MRLEKDLDAYAPAPGQCSYSCPCFLLLGLQALVNIAWSFATLINGVCATHTTIRQLFSLIHTESILR